MKQLCNITFIVFFSLSIRSQVGIATTNPKSTLDVNGNLSVKVVTLTGNGSGNSGASVLINDGIYINLNPVVNDDKFELPNPVNFPGRTYTIRNINNTITAQLRSASGLLFSKNSTTGSTQIYMYEGNLRTVIVYSDGVNWTYIN